MVYIFTVWQDVREGEVVKKALQVLEEGLTKFNHSFYIHKDYFDICRWANDRLGMERAYNNLKSIAGSGNANFSIALLCREAYLSAFQGKSKVVIGLKLKLNSHLTDNAIENIIAHVDAILRKGHK